MKSTIELKKHKSLLLFCLAAVSIVVFALVAPEQAHAIDFPNIPGVSANDDPITIIAKVAAFILKVVIFMIFAAVFVIAAYVLVSTLAQMIKDRTTAGDLIGRLAASLVVVVLSFWFLSEGEKAADQLKDLKLAKHVTIEQIVA